MLRTRRPGRSGRLFLTATLGALAALAAGAPSQAKAPLSMTLTVPQAVDRTCFKREFRPGPGLAKRTVTAPTTGLIRVGLRASAGNWDLGIFDAKTARSVVGSAHFGAHELAEGVVQKGQGLVIQACRRTGRTEQARITVSFETLDLEAKVQLVRVSTPTRAARQTLHSLGFEELTEHPGPDYTDVLIQPKDVARIGRAGLISIELEDDVNARNRAEDGLNRPSAITGLPSGRTGPYRHLADYTSEMNALATSHPSIVKKFTLPLMTLEPPGRPVEGIEISTDVNARDGKPVFLMMGLHHAREWPSGEHTMEWAFELICGFSPDPPGAPDTPCPDSLAAPDARVVGLLQNIRVLIVPVVNPDGFNISREVGEVAGHGNGHDGDPLTSPNEYRRKNCRNDAPLPPAPATGSCAGPAFGVGSTGVDLNRNYGTFWGGPGSDPTFVGETFHGPHCVNDEPVKQDDILGNPNCGPFSERETENMRSLISGRHAVTLITNHTQSGLVLRAPGLASQGLAPDEPAMKALGDLMAAQNGYTSQYGWQLYDTTGTTEDWSYNTTGGYGYTFEIGRPVFHPTFLKTIQEYDGTSLVFPAATGGNREAYFLAAESTANTVHHSVLAGSAPAGAVLRLKKVFQTPTSIQNPDNSLKTFTDTLDTTMVVPGSGSYQWHINPSTRPIVMNPNGRIATGDPSPPVPISGSVAGPPADGAVPCANTTSPPASCTNVHPFTIPPQGGGIDNALVAIRLSWPTPGSDWDMQIFRDVNGNGVVDAPDGAKLAFSEGSTTAAEATSISEPFTPGQYLVRVINWAAAEPYEGSVTFYGPKPPAGASTESWTMTCEMPEGTPLETVQVFINRGQQMQINFGPGCELGPTGVELASFAARRAKGGVTVSWRTANERNITGFNVWRAGKKLNRSLIAAKRSGTVAGATYRIVDRKARAGVAYTYRLQAVARDGSRAWVRKAILSASR